MTSVVGRFFFLSKDLFLNDGWINFGDEYGKVDVSMKWDWPILIGHRRFFCETISSFLFFSTGGRPTTLQSKLLQHAPRFKYLLLFELFPVSNEEDDSEQPIRLLGSGDYGTILLSTGNDVTS